MASQSLGVTAITTTCSNVAPRCAAKARKGLGTGRSHRERGIGFARGALVVRKDGRRDSVFGKLRTQGLSRLMCEHRDRIARIAHPAQSAQLAIRQQVFIHAKGQHRRRG